MAKPRIFLSSTFFDLKQVRADLDQFIESLGYEPVRNEEGDIPFGKSDALEEYCYKEIQNIDILISIIGGRFGSESSKSLNSISQQELKTALKEEKQVYIFIDKNVLAEYETYLLNKENGTKYRYVDDLRIYQFLEEIKGLPNNNNIKGFESTSEIVKYLKEQFAGLFQRFLAEQTRIKEISLIKNLENTAKTLNKLVNYLSDDNKDKAEELNTILMINHPIVEKLSTLLSIPYNFYIEGIEDLGKLLTARNFKGIEDDERYFRWMQSKSSKTEIINISRELFDKDDKLKFIKRTDWNEEYITLEEQTKPDDDDIPF